MGEGLGTGLEQEAKRVGHQDQSCYQDTQGAEVLMASD